MATETFHAQRPAGPYLRAFRNAAAGLDILRARITGRKAPVAVIWHLTYRCNYNCLYCGVKARAGHELAEEEVLGMIRELGRAGTRRIHFSGGETLLRQDLPGILELCARSGIETGIISNGALVPQSVHLLKQLRVLKISLDGPREVNDSIRGKGSFDRALAAAEAARKAGISVVLNCTLHSRNLHAVEAFLLECEKAALRVKFSPVSGLHSGTADIGPLLPDTETYRSAINFLIKSARYNRLILNSVPSLRYMLSYPEGAEIPNCAAGRIFCHIKPDGSIYPCERKTDIRRAWPHKDGVSAAFNSLPKTGCGSCWCTGTLELNNLYALKPLAVAKAVILGA